MRRRKDEAGWRRRRRAKGSWVAGSHFSYFYDASGL